MDLTFDNTYERGRTVPHVQETYKDTDVAKAEEHEAFFPSMTRERVNSTH